MEILKTNTLRDISVSIVQFLNLSSSDSIGKHKSQNLTIAENVGLLEYNAVKLFFLCYALTRRSGSQLIMEIRGFIIGEIILT